MTRLTLSGSALAEVAAWAARLVPSRPTVPSLAGVVLDAGDHGLTVSTYDFDTAGRTTLPAEVDTPGRVLVSANLLAAVTKTLRARDTAVLTDAGQVLRVDIGKSQGWELPTLDLDVYPSLPELPPGVATVDGHALAEAIGRVLPAVNPDPTDAKTAGIYLSGDGDTLTLAATDRYRLAVAEVAYEALGDTPEIAEALLPGPLARHLAGVAGHADDGAAAHLHLDAVHAGMNVGDGQRVAFGRLYDASIAWRRIALTAEQTAESWTLVEVDELRGAVDRAATMLGNGESLRLTFDEDGVTVRPALGTKGRAEHGCDVVSHHGGPREIGVSGRYLHEALGTLDGPQVRVGFVERDWQPFLLTPARDGEVLPGYRHVVAQQKQAVAHDAAAA